ncbi:hypothetical protein NKT34_29440 [Paenibacillus polysaccharolyticus]|uniref:hypothetical protein n=1 Tax=Paenibacillus polysaccharolyticus TaxID=582692 RepID=UPI00209C8753|nr:hypothetical protein [Paenibacillus polysaccharolyticus]MCP1137383.1 hypothetical protein [Paenibacillus polysaccharolyticus]
MSLKRYTYRIQPLSKLALSPREHQGYHLAAGDFKTEEIRDLNAKDIKIIYPFYQYGSYESYQPDKTEYYIPGSSIKGALISGIQKNPAKLMVDDIRIEQGDLELTQLHKLQHMSQDASKSVKLAPFFPNVAVEMLKAGCGCAGELFCEADVSTYLQTAHKKTLDKLKQLHDKLVKMRRDNIINEAAIQHVSDLIGNIDRVRDTHHDSCLLLLGGYKGLVLSGLFDITDFDKLETAVYVDQPACLPYGLVQITDIKEMV